MKGFPLQKVFSIPLKVSILKPMREFSFKPEADSPLDAALLVHCSPLPEHFIKISALKICEIFSAKESFDTISPLSLVLWAEGAGKFVTCPRCSDSAPTQDHCLSICSAQSFCQFAQRRRRRKSAKSIPSQWTSGFTLHFRSLYGKYHEFEKLRLRALPFSVKLRASMLNKQNHHLNLK